MKKIIIFCLLIIAPKFVFADTNTLLDDTFLKKTSDFSKIQKIQEYARYYSSAYNLADNNFYRDFEEAKKVAFKYNSVGSCRQIHFYLEDLANSLGYKDSYTVTVLTPEMGHIITGFDVYIADYDNIFKANTGNVIEDLELYAETNNYPKKINYKFYRKTKKIYEGVSFRGKQILNDIKINKNKNFTETNFNKNLTGINFFKEQKENIFFKTYHFSDLENDYNNFSGLSLKINTPIKNNFGINFNLDYFYSNSKITNTVYDSVYFAPYLRYKNFKFTYLLNVDYNYILNYPTLQNQKNFNVNYYFSDNFFIQFQKRVNKNIFLVSYKEDKKFFEAEYIKSDFNKVPDQFFLTTNFCTEKKNWNICLKFLGGINI